MNVIGEKSGVPVEDNEKQTRNRLNTIGIVEQTAGDMHEIIANFTILMVAGRGEMDVLAKQEQSIAQLDTVEDQTGDARIGREQRQH